MQYVENSGADNAFELHDTAANLATGKVSLITFIHAIRLIFMRITKNFLLPNILKIFMHTFHLKVQAVNCANSGLIISVPIDEHQVTEGIYCGSFLGSLAEAKAPNVIPGDNYLHYLSSLMKMYIF